MSIASLLDQRLTLQRQQVTAGRKRRVRADLHLVAVVRRVRRRAGGAAVVADYARRDMRVDTRIHTTVDLDSLAAGGARLGDRFTDGLVFYLVKTVKKTVNAAVSADKLYEIDCEQIR